MTLQGTVIDGVVVLDNGQALPDGTRVEVGTLVPPAKKTPPAENTKPQPTLTALLEVAGSVDDLPPDMARNHDHYVHGTPKR